MAWTNLGAVYLSLGEQGLANKASLSVLSRESQSLILSMVEEQRIVVANLQKTKKGTPMEEVVSEEARKLLSDLKLNKVILDKLKSSLREVVDSNMRTETETGPSCSVGQLLQLLWRQFVAAGPKNVSLDLTQVDFKAEGEDVQQLVQSGIATLDGDNLKLVNFTCEK